MRLRPNHSIRPQLVEAATQRCHELLIEAQTNSDLDDEAIVQILYDEFDGDGHAVLSCCRAHQR